MNKWLLFGVLLSFNTLYFAQMKFSDLSGSVNLTSNYYHASGDIENRQQETLSRAIIRLSFNIHPQIKLPFEVYLTSLKNRYQQPFNQFGINPVISDWLILHGGYFSSRVSDLTFGDLRILGGGIEINKWDLRLKLLYGITKKAIDPDSAANYLGTYKQTMYAVSAGYGNERSSFINLNLFHAVDDSESITPIRNDSLIHLTPNENLISSIDFGLAFSNLIDIKGEAAISAFTNDLSSARADTFFTFGKFLFKTRTSSQIDGAAKMVFNVHPSKFWSLSLLGRWIGPGYKTLGYSWLQNDIFELSAGPTIRLFQSRWIVRGSAGVNRNNLRNNRESTTRRFNGRMSIYGQLLKNLAIDIQYLNNQIRSYHLDDYIRASNVFNSVSLTPAYNFNGPGGRNLVSFNYTHQTASDRNPQLYSPVKNVTNMFNGIYSIYFSSLTLTTNIIYNTSRFVIYSYKTVNIGETISSHFWNHKLSFLLNLGYNNSGREFGNKQLLMNLMMTYKFQQYGNVSLNVTNNNYNGLRNQLNVDITDKIKYNEMQASLQYNLNF